MARQPAPPEVHRIVSDATGSAPPTELLRAVLVATAGLPFLVHAAAAALSSADGVTSQVRESPTRPYDRE